MTVGEIMRTDVRACDAGDSLDVAAKRMWDGRCGCIPVVDAGGNVVGVITDRDVCMAAYTQNRPLSALTVADAMSREAFTAATSDPIASAAHLMREHGVRRIPVVDDAGRLAGILSLEDLVLAVARSEPRQPAPGATSPSLAELLEIVCAHAKPRPHGGDRDVFGA